jgi:hypothetical protein
MKAFRDYWTFTSIRGVMTLLAALASTFIPLAASSILEIPVLTGLAVACFATYCVLDTGAMLLLGKLFPAGMRGARTLYGQAAAGAAAAVLLFAAGYGVISLASVVWIAAAHAAAAAYAEMRVARDTHAQYGCLSCYATAIVLAASAGCLPFTHALNATGIALALSCYVGLYGLSDVALGGRMLFLEYRSAHPTGLQSVAWKAAMDQPAIAQHAVAAVLGSTPLACAVCAECPVDPLCNDLTLQGQVERLLMERQPSIVRSIRVTTLLNSTAQRAWNGALSPGSPTNVTGW